MTIQIYRTIILPVVLCGCETWSLTLKEELWLRVFESRVLRRIFRPRRDEVTGEWKKLRNEELNDLYSTPNTILVMKLRRMRWAGHVARMGQRQLGIPRRRWEDNIKKDLQEVRLEAWTRLIWLRLGTVGGCL
jgi:hypothetical protein